MAEFKALAAQDPKRAAMVLTNRCSDTKNISGFRIFCFGDMWGLRHWAVVAAGDCDAQHCVQNIYSKKRGTQTDFHRGLPYSILDLAGEQQQQTGEELAPPI